MDVYRISIIILKRYLDYWITSQFLLHLCNYNQLLRLKKKRKAANSQTETHCLSFRSHCLFGSCLLPPVRSYFFSSGHFIHSAKSNVADELGYYCEFSDRTRERQQRNSERKLFYYVYTADGVACDHLMACLSRDFRHRNQTLLTIFLCQVSMSIFNMWIIGVF